MFNRSTIRLVASVLVLTMILGAFQVFNTGSILAANNKSAVTGSTGAQDGSSQAKPAGAQDGNSQINGQLIARGSVTVNGNRAITGTTVFTDSHIVVDSTNGNSAIVNLGKLGRIELIAGTKLTLRFSDGLISGNLEAGKAVVNVPDGVKVNIDTPNQDAAIAGQEPVKVIVVRDTVVSPPPTAAPAPVPVPVPSGGGGLGGWGTAGVIAGAAGITGGAIALADDDDDLFVAPVSAVIP